MNAHSFVYVGNLVAATVNFLRSALGALSRQGRALTPEEKRQSEAIESAAGHLEEALKALSPFAKSAAAAG